MHDGLVLKCMLVYAGWEVIILKINFVEECFNPTPDYSRGKVFRKLFRKIIMYATPDHSRGKVFRKLFRKIIKYEINHLIQ